MRSILGKCYTEQVSIGEHIEFSRAELGSTTIKIGRMSSPFWRITGPNVVHNVCILVL
jgi:hypothetical protein